MDNSQAYYRTLCDIAADTAIDEAGRIAELYHTYVLDCTNAAAWQAFSERVQKSPAISYIMATGQGWTFGLKFMIKHILDGRLDNPHATN